MPEELRETLFDQLYTPLLVLDQQHRIAYHNAAFAHLLPASLPRLQGLPLARLESLASILSPLLIRCQSEQRRCIGRQLALDQSHLGGSNTLLVDVVVTPIEQATGQQLMVEFTGLDPWGQERAQQQRWQQTQALQLMVQGLCHEIRNPLSGMRAAAQLLEQEIASGEGITEDAQDYTRLIQQQVDRINQLIQNFSQQAQAPRWESLNLHQLLDDVLALHAQTDEALQIERDYDPSIPELQGEAGLLSQLLLNLVKNATQAAASTVRIMTRVQHQYPLPQGENATVVVISVIDNGRGVPGHLRDILFLPMVSARPEGTGLGLAVAQQVAHHHGGILQYEALAQGSAFHCVLPLRVAEVSPATPDAAHSATHGAACHD